MRVRAGGSRGSRHDVRRQWMVAVIRMRGGVRKIKISFALLGDGSTARREEILSEPRTLPTSPPTSDCVILHGPRDSCCRLLVSSKLAFCSRRDVRNTRRGVRRREAKEPDLSNRSQE